MGPALTKKHNMKRIKVPGKLLAAAVKAASTHSLSLLHRIVTEFDLQRPEGELFEFGGTNGISDAGHTITSDIESTPVYIGIGHAPQELARRCLMVTSGWRVKLEEHPIHTGETKQVLIFETVKDNRFYTPVDEDKVYFASTEFVKEMHGEVCSTWQERLEKELPDAFEIKTGYKIGDRFTHSDGDGYTGEYILAQIARNTISLISTESGNRWHDGVEVKNVMNVTAKEWERLLGSGVKCFKRVEK